MERLNRDEFRRILASRVRIVLKASREDSDRSQQELATSLGWSRNMIANLETGRRVIGFVDFVILAKALHVEPERLLRRVLQW
jgi:transcriptional regulator with XRE-family HTH domain